MLARITAQPGQFNAAFVDEFKVFTRELRDFFNAAGARVVRTVLPIGSSLPVLPADLHAMFKVTL
jgi:hypothetical protein